MPLFVVIAFGANLYEVWLPYCFISLPCGSVDVCPMKMLLVNAINIQEVTYCKVDFDWKNLTGCGRKFDMAGENNSPTLICSQNEQKPTGCTINLSKLREKVRNYIDKVRTSVSICIIIYCS